MQKSGAAVARDAARPRRERERAFRTQLILEAAEEVFAARGLHGASVEEIAARAEAAIATLYKLFGSKEEIFAALIAYRQDEFLAEVEAAAGTGATPAERLERLVDAIFRYFERHQATFRVYLSGTHGFLWSIRSSFGERTFAKYEQFLDFLATLLADGMRTGAWPKDDAQRLAVAAMGAVNGLLTRRYTRDPRTDLAAEIREAQKLVARIAHVPPAGIAARRGRRP
jgi:AcrR family transcriptional regulator